MKLVFENTGDELLFDAVNHEVLELFGDCKFVSNNQYNAVADLWQQINYCADIINKFLESSEIRLEFPKLHSLSQRNLNSMHAVWANIYNYHMFKILDHKSFIDFFEDESEEKSLSEITSRISDPQIKHSFENYNHLIHKIETQFGTNKTFSTKDRIWFDTPNMKYNTSNNIANLSIPSSFIGRTLENKFRYFDNDLEFSDENNWDQTPQQLSINFGKSRTIPYSKEYIDWCKRLQREPLGHYLNVGNFVNIDENLTTYRTIMYNNTQAENSFSIRK